MATVIMVSPAPSTALTPKRLTSFPVCEAIAMIVRAMGRKVRPARSGDRPSTCCRYSELTYHMGNSAALNRITLVLAPFRGPLSCLNGISGALAIRASITVKATSRARPPRIGPRAAAACQLTIPDCTTP